jgi:hypothetical protein
MSRAFKLTLLSLFIVVAGAAIFLLRRDNARLRQRLAAQRHAADLGVQLRAENQRTQELIARLQGDAADGIRAIQTDLARARFEVADLEKRAEAGRARKLTQAASDTAALAASRDPTKGLTRLEHFQNVGSATPEAAFQTLGWAGMNGDETVLQSLVGLTDGARKAAETLIAGLPDHERVRWNPEKFAGMFFAELIIEVPAVHLLETRLEADGQQATLLVRVPSAGNRDATQRVRMQRGAKGWQATVSERQIEQLRNKFQALPAEGSKK